MDSAMPALPGARPQVSTDSALQTPITSLRVAPTGHKKLLANEHYTIAAQPERHARTSSSFRAELTSSAL